VSDHPVVSPPSPAEAVPDRDLVGVVLAAGTSSRFGGRNKLTEPVDGTPMGRRVAETLLAAHLDGVAVVVGHGAAAVRATVADLAVAVLENDAYADGQSTSVRRGVAWARERGADAAVFALGDMPDVDPGSVDALVATYALTGRSALAAAYDGDRGNPVLFDAAHFDALAELDGDRGGRAVLLDAADAALVETGDPGVRRDVDEPGDLDGS
jgi:molybdenum cofactor cytidylyltransferase